MRSVFLLPSALLLALAACGAPAGNEGAAGNAAVPEPNAAAPADPAPRAETVTGTFAGWEMGDYLWARINVPGREPISAQPGRSPIDLFLDAHRGREVIVEIATQRTHVPEAGGEVEIARIVAARSGATTAEAWWQGLSAADRAAARRRFEEGALSGN